MTTQRPAGLRGALGVAVIAAAVGGLAACGTGPAQEPANRVPAQPPASPGTATSLQPNDIRATDLTVSGGKFDTDKVTLQEDRPSILRITNADATPYRFEVAPNLVVATPVPASGRTEVQFTNPLAGSYDGNLLPAEGGGPPIDKVEIEVQSASGLNPGQSTNTQNQSGVDQQP